jgi:hypothetical protein
LYEYLTGAFANLSIKKDEKNKSAQNKEENHKISQDFTLSIYIFLILRRIYDTIL